MILEQRLDMTEEQIPFRMGAVARDFDRRYDITHRQTESGQYLAARNLWVAN